MPLFSEGGPVRPWRPDARSFFRRAVEAERAGAELVARVAAYLRRAEGDPELPFEAENALA